MDNHIYRLRIEWHPMNMYFTHSIDNTSLDQFNHDQFASFLSHNAYDEFILREVESVKRKVQIDCDEYIESYNLESHDLFFNYVATSPDDNQVIILRDTELLFFPKYFENWIITPITDKTYSSHINQFRMVREFVFEQLELFSFASVVTQTLLIVLFNEQNYNSYYQTPKLIEYLVTIQNCLNDYNGYNHVFEDWEVYCKQLLSWYTTNHNQKINKDNYYQVILEFQQYLDNWIFFFDYFDDFEIQNDLFVGTEFDILNRRYELKF